jgi:hypothetical protein
MLQGDHIIFTYGGAFSSSPTPGLYHDTCIGQQHMLYSANPLNVYRQLVHVSTSKTEYGLNLMVSAMFMVLDVCAACELLFLCADRKNPLAPGYALFSAITW